MRYTLISERKLNQRRAYDISCEIEMLEKIVAQGKLLSRQLPVAQLQQTRYCVLRFNKRRISGRLTNSINQNSFARYTSKAKIKHLE